MVDFSKYSKDKDNYISKLEIDSLFQTFKVIYASGREEVQDFTIHNYQVYVYKMEEQYRRYHGVYMEDKAQDYVKVVNKRLLFLSIASIWGIIGTISVDVHLMIRVFLILASAFVSIYNFKKIREAKKEFKKEEDKLAMIEVLLNHKEDIALEVTDPGTGRKESWYMVDVNNIDQFQSSGEMLMYTMPYHDPMIKQEMEESLDGAFQNAYTLKKRKKQNTQ